MWLLTTSLIVISISRFRVVWHKLNFYSNNQKREWGWWLPWIGYELVWVKWKNSVLSLVLCWPVFPSLILPRSERFPFCFCPCLAEGRFSSSNVACVAHLLFVCLFFCGCVRKRLQFHSRARVSVIHGACSRLASFGSPHRFLPPRFHRPCPSLHFSFSLCFCCCLRPIGARSRRITGVAKSYRMVFV
jgi:hypothetical protein